MNSVALTGHLAEYRAQGRSIHIDHMRAAASGSESAGIDAASGQPRLYHDGDVGNGQTLRVVTTPDRKTALTAWYMSSEEASADRARKQSAAQEREQADKERRGASQQGATKARVNKAEQKQRQWQRAHVDHTTPSPRCPLC
jgi:hypothetical protein